MTSAYDKEEKAILKAKLKDLGYAVSPNASLDTLKEKYEQACSENNKLDSSDSDSVKSIEELRNEIRKDALKLIRVRISNLNPNKQGLHGEIFTVCNDIIGKVSKYVPWDEAGQEYHIPNVILKHLQSREFLQIHTHKSPKTGQIIVDTSYVPEFAIEILPPLTKEELDELALKQAARDNINE